MFTTLFIKTKGFGFYKLLIKVFTKLKTQINYGLTVIYYHKTKQFKSIIFSKIKKNVTFHRLNAYFKRQNTLSLKLLYYVINDCYLLILIIKTPENSISKAFPSNHFSNLL